MLANVSKLSDKAMLVKLTIRRAALTRRDNALTEKVRSNESDNSLTVLTKLFQDKDGPIYSIMSQTNEVYTYHKAHTLPYVDAGPRILPNNNYYGYTADMQKRVAQVERLLDTYMPHYDQLVRDDIMYRNAGKAAGRAHEADYPTAAQFRQSMSLEFRFSPMPDARHFLFDLSDDDIKKCEQAELEAAQAANSDILQRMLEPLGKLVHRLDEYRGDPGQRWHNSILENVLDGISQARSLMLFPTPQLNDTIDALERETKRYLDNVEIVKASPGVRVEARRKLDELAATLNGYF